jgi:hypothetical protein
MASSILSALGITQAAPPASAYADQSAETANLANAQSQLAGITTNLGLALSAAKIAGIDTTNLDNLNAEAASLATTNLTSAQLQAKTSALSAKLSTAQATQNAQRQADAVAAMQSAVSTIQARVAVIKRDSTTSAGLLTQYTALQKSSEDALAALKAMPVTPSSANSGSGVATPVVPDPSTFLNELDDLDTAKDAEENKTFNWTRFGKKITSVMMYYGTIITVGLGVIMGAIIMSNTYASDPFWGIKLYYFIYGGAFFPLSLIYGAYNPPYWVSAILPLYSLDPVRVQSGGVLSLPTFTMPTLPKMPTASDLAEAVLGRVKSLVKPTDAAASAAPAARTAPATLAARTASAASLTAPTLSTSDSMFGYSLVDPNTPTAAQTASRNKLRYFAIGELVFLGISATYYGVDALITKNLIKV